MTPAKLDDLVEQLAADLCDRARRPARSAYHPESWELAGQQNGGPPESTQRDWWRRHAREVIAWVIEHSEHAAETSTGWGVRTGAGVAFATASEFQSLECARRYPDQYTQVRRTIAYGPWQDAWPPGPVGDAARDAS